MAEVEIHTRIARLASTAEVSGFTLDNIDFGIGQRLKKCRKRSIPHQHESDEKDLENTALRSNRYQTVHIRTEPRQGSCTPMLGVKKIIFIDTIPHRSP